MNFIQKRMNLMDAKNAYYENEIKRLKKENNEMMEFCAAAEIDIAYEEARCKALMEERKAIIRTWMMRNSKIKAAWCKHWLVCNKKSRFSLRLFWVGFPWSVDCSVGGRLALFRLLLVSFSRLPGPRIKVIAKREAARKSYLRKKEYCELIKRKLDLLEKMVALMTTLLANYRNINKWLAWENNEIRKGLAARQFS
ncbi:hypothetical protein QYF36_007476 [Acer negundo]|nr:hypothetical protein QYF36_007476 [Acer negundo]